jgi:hypothetical protein
VRAKAREQRRRGKGKKWKEESTVLPAALFFTGSDGHLTATATTATVAFGHAAVKEK